MLKLLPLSDDDWWSRWFKSEVLKNIVWMAQGYPNVAHFRNAIFTAKDIDETMDVTREYFSQIQGGKRIDHSKDFMAGGHG